MTPPWVAQRVWARPVVAGCAVGADRVAQHGDLADPPRDVGAAVDQADAGGVVAAVLQPLEPREQELLARPATDISDDSTHISPLRSRPRRSPPDGCTGPSHNAASSASTITRTTGSVPEARSTTRPSSPSFASAASTSCQIRREPASALRSAGTATRRCGNGHDEVGELRHRHAQPVERREQHERGREAVAGRVVGEVDHVPGLLAAERRPGREHAGEHVAVADLGHLDRDAVARHHPVEAQVRHRGDHHALDAAGEGDRGDDRVAVHGPAARVDREAAVGIAVERKAARRPGLAHRTGDGVEVRRAHAGIDVAAVRRHTEVARRDAEPREEERRGVDAAPLAQSTDEAARRGQRRRRRCRRARTRSRRRRRASSSRRRPARPGPIRRAPPRPPRRRRRACARRRR